MLRSVGNPSRPWSQALEPQPRLTPELGADPYNTGALPRPSPGVWVMVRIGFGGILYYSYNNEPPQNPILITKASTLSPQPETR